MKSDSELSSDDPAASLTVLTNAVEEFIAAWESPEAPPWLNDFLPPPGAHRGIILIELVKVDLEYRWGDCCLPKKIEEYVEEFPELAVDGIPADLVYEEFHLRKQSGLNADPQEYMQRFPEQASVLARLLGMGDEYESTAIWGGEAKKHLEQFQLGQVLDDFTLLAMLGEGAFAKVFLARQESMQRLVALKISANRGTEHQTLAQMDHDHIVRVYDLRVMPETGLRLLYMQYLGGGTLQQVVRKLRETPLERRTGRVLLKAIDEALENRGESRPVDNPLRAKLEHYSWPAMVAWLGSRLAHALEYSHQRNTLHRDVKPANVLLTSDGVPKLADFNISFTSNISGATPAAYFGGSLAYMSPEQMEAYNPGHLRKADSLDGRSDLYSLGVLLWELLTGERPFHDEKIKNNWDRTLQDMVERRQQGLDTSRGTLPLNCPPRLITILKIALEPDPENRWQGGDEMARQLELCLKPRAENILTFQENDWRLKMNRWGLPLVILFCLIPNALAGWFNYAYNVNEIISLLSESSQEKFWNIQAMVNLIAYPVGIGFGVYWSWGFIGKGRAMIRQGILNSRSTENHATIRKRCLMFGNVFALICVVEWVIAGIAYPFIIQHVAGEMPPGGFIHFLLSLLICGLIAAAYPFFLVTWFCLRVYYPALLQGDLTRAEDRQWLLALRKYSWFYFCSAMAVPMLAVFAALLFADLGTQTRQSLAILVGVSLLGFLAIFFQVFPRLQDDLDAILDALQTDSTE